MDDLLTWPRTEHRPRLEERLKSIPGAAGYFIACRVFTQPGSKADLHDQARPVLSAQEQNSAPFQTRTWQHSSQKQAIRSAIEPALDGLRFLTGHCAPETT
jgi:hypothetical protein